MIDVVKSQHEIKKNKKLVLTNEVKIITASDETFDLWSEVISAAAQGDLMDVDSKTFSKFKERVGFEADKDAVLNREFFKFLGNLTEADHAKMCRHMLNRSGPSRTLNYPKVVVKQPATLLRDCYSYKDWIERRKRKVTARFQLNRLRPDLGIFTADGSEYVEEAWKKFKKDFNVTKASKRVLLDWGVPDSYYTLARATMNRNTTCEDISPYAQEFFKVFLDKRGAFQAPTGSICFRPFVTEPSTAPPRLGNWSSNQWREAGRNSKVGIIDFRFIPGVAGIKESTVSKPYFERFLELLASSGQPAGLSDLPCWLFICGSEDALEQVAAFAQRPPHGAVFDLFRRCTFRPRTNGWGVTQRRAGLRTSQCSSSSSSRKSWMSFLELEGSTRPRSMSCTRSRGCTRKWSTKCTPRSCGWSSTSKWWTSFASLGILCSRSLAG